MDERGHIKTRVHPKGSRPFTRREEDDLRRCVATQCDTCDTRQLYIPNVRAGLGTAKYCLSRYLLIHREPGNIREVSGEYRDWSSVTYWVLKNLPHIREVLRNGLTSEFGHLSGVAILIEHPRGFSKAPTSEFRHLPGIGKPAKHLSSFTFGTFVTSTTLCTHSSQRFSELRGSARNMNRC